MKHAKGFIISVYAGIILLLISPVVITVILTAGKSDSLFFVPYFFVLLPVFAAVIGFGIHMISNARKFLQTNEIENLCRLWGAVKLICVPAYLINFGVCVLIGSLGFLLFPLNIVVILVNSAYVFLCVILSGFAGCFAIKSIKKAGGNINSACCVIQFIPFWDVICTVVIFIKYKLLS